MDLSSILQLIIATFASFGQMAGIAVLVVAIVNALKTFGLVNDGTAAQWFAGLDFGAIVALVAAQLIWPQISVAIYDQDAGLLGAVIVLMLGYLVSMGLAPKIHALFVNAKIKFIGKSFSKTA
jgi:hypothetical protein